MIRALLEVRHEILVTGKNEQLRVFLRRSARLSPSLSSSPSDIDTSPNMATALLNMATALPNMVADLHDMVSR